MIRLKSLLKEINSSIELAFERIDKLPAGKLFNDAKSIKDIFTLSKHSWSEVIENFEKNKENGTNENVDISNIHITQPNIQSNKVKHIIENINKMPIINVVQFNDGEMAIYDGHHRLVANWALGNQNIKVNLVKLNTTKYDASNINKIEEIGPQNFIEMYLDWLEELLNDLEDSNDIEAIKRYDTVLNARFALEDADSTEIIQYLQQKYGNNVDQIILKILGDTTKYDASGIDTPGDPNM